VSTAERSNLHDLERELTRFFRRSRVASTAIAAEVHPDLDVASYTVLVTISDLSSSLPGGVRAIDVADTLGLHKSTMSRNIGVLERLGLVGREPSAEDARARILTITEPGRTSLDAAISARRQRVSSILGRWSESDVRDLARLLGQLNDDLAQS
jgi:DNA-binding MarR family transcriptional regulator